MAEASQLFSQKANDYRSGRTYYPKAIASILRELELPGNKAVDAGCGTGIFSQLLLDCGFTVYGVEPNAEMLCAAKEQLHCSQFVPIQSTAEEIPLPDHSVEFICAAQSFHWFDRDAFRLCCNRLLRPGGKIALIWNTKDPAHPLMQGYQTICRSLCERFHGFHNGLDLTGPAVTGFFQAAPQIHRLQNPQTRSREQFFHWCLSSSYSPRPGEPVYNDFLRCVGDLFDQYQCAGQIILPSQTLLYIGD